MLRIRFLRQGKRHQPFYKIIVTNSKKSPKSGKFIEEVGFYNPLTKERRIKKERVLDWLKKGAQPSDTVYNLLIKERVIKGKKKPVHSTKSKAKEEKESSQSSSKEETSS